MPTRSRATPRSGRPRGAKSFDATVAAAFGEVVREARLTIGLSQEALAHQAQVERSYLGRMERGQSQPTLFVLLKVATALGSDGSTLVDLIEKLLAKTKRHR